MTHVCFCGIPTWDGRAGWCSLDHQHQLPTWQTREDARRRVRLTCWCGAKAWNSITRNADGVRPGYCCEDHKATFPQWGPPPGQQWYRTYLSADGSQMVEDRRPCSLRCGRAARNGQDVCCARCGTQGHEAACDAEWQQVRAVGGYGRLSAAGASARKADPGQPDRGTQPPRQNEAAKTEAADPPPPRQDGPAKTEAADPPPPPAQEPRLCNKCGQRGPYAHGKPCGVCLFGAEIQPEAVEACAADGTSRVYCSHHLTRRSQQAEQEWLRRVSAHKKASRPPFNTRYLAPPAAEPNVETYNVPSFGLKLPRLVQSIFEKTAVRSTLAHLGVPVPVESLNELVQGKLSKVEELCDFLRWQVQTDPGINLEAVQRMYTFATRVRLLTPEEAKTPEDWTALVDGLVHRDYCGRWGETRLLHVKNVMLIFGFSADTQRRYAATALQNDPSQTWGQYLCDQAYDCLSRHHATCRF